METVQYLAMAMGLAWVSGINLYATVAVLGALGATGHMALPEQLAPLMDPMVITIAAFMYFVEFFADKTPGVDTGWDAIHTFIRIPAGAILAAQAVAPVSQEAQLVAFLLGGAVAASSHAVKATTRLGVNASPEPFSNWTLSVSEDFVALLALWATFNHPYIMLGFVAVFFVFALWITPKIFRAAREMFRKASALFAQEKGAS